jgi:dTDP-3-amino-3,4,6-trideoxy-alpha-D-glucose transaminase
MKVPFLDLSRESDELGGELEAAVGRVLAGGRFVLGEAVEEFERAWARYCGAGHAVGVGSGTDAVTLALQAVGVGPGDEVITAANTCVPTVAGIEAAGAVPVLADVRPDTFTLDPAGLARSLGERTRAIVPVHLYGQCADVEPILAFAREHGLKVIEDAAQAHGAEYSGRRAGSLGDAAAFSFYPTKNLGAAGDGGAVVTNSAEVAARARLLRVYGEDENRVSHLRGRNSRLDALQAAVLSVKLRRLEAWNERRKALAARYVDALADSDLALPLEAPGRRHVYHLFVVRSPRRDDLRQALAGRGIDTMTHYARTVHQHPAYASLAGQPGSLATSEQLAREVLSLPLYPQLTEAEVDAVCETVLEALSVALNA